MLYLAALANDEQNRERRNFCFITPNIYRELRKTDEPRLIR